MSARPSGGLPGREIDPNDITDLDLVGVSDGIARKAFSSVEATRAYLAKIERHDPVLRAYITVTADLALDQARQADAELARGEGRGPLHGVPIALKDLIAVDGVRLTGGSALLIDNVAGEDAPVWEKLRGAGAVLLGKLSMHEFAFGRPAVDDPFPTGRNPWDVARITGGSSSGSGAAAAAGLCAGALGSDTGGSIRGPAALCGLVGHKPTYGLVSRRGVLPMCWSLDHVGPMTRTVRDSALLLQAIAGYDMGDASTMLGRPDNYTRMLEAGVAGMTFGVPSRFYLDWPGLHPDVRQATLRAFRELERQGARFVDVDAPTFGLAPAIWAAFLAEMYEYHRELLAARADEYREGTRVRLYMGAMVSAQDYLRAQRLRSRLAREVADILSRVDALVFPGFAEPAAPFPTEWQKELMLPGSRYTQVWNLLGLPACNVPSGFSAEGLPVSLQIVGRPFADATVLRIARAYERATPWHTRRPDPAGWRL
jgi:aspartyl-tRNA(Asn)/glutamyl-tRNA(Gln) amidotransferase subunit A